MLVFNHEQIFETKKLLACYQTHLRGHEQQCTFKRARIAFDKTTFYFYKVQGIVTGQLVMLTLES